MRFQTCPTCGRGEKRSLEQNDKYQPMCREIAKHVQWHGVWLDADDWRHIFTATIKKQRSVPNLDGTGFVILGASSKKLTKQEASDMIELIHAFAAEHGVTLQEAA